VLRQLGDLGVLGIGLPEKYSGARARDGSPDPAQGHDRKQRAGPQRCVEELNELPLRDASKERILRQNAIEFLGL